MLHSEAEVSTEELARAILATVLLANVQAGAVRLEVRPKKTLFGLRTVQTLYVEPAAEQSDWLTHSLEARLLDTARTGKANKGRNEAAHVVAALLGEDTLSPWAHAIGLVSDGLASRGLLETLEKTRLKVFKSQEYVLSEMVRRAAAAEEISIIQAWLERTRQEQPEMWKLLQDHLKTAVQWRTENDDDLDFD